MKLLELTVKVAAVPLKVTRVAPVRLVPRILTVAPALAETGSVGALDRDRISVLAVRAIALGAKAVSRFQRAGRVNLEHVPRAIGAAVVGGAVQVAIGGLGQRRKWQLAVRPIEAV